MKNNCIYISACGGDTCARCKGSATIGEIKRKLKTAKTEKEKTTYNQLIARYESFLKEAKT